MNIMLHNEIVNMVQEDIQVQETLRYQRENLSTCQHQVQRIQVQKMEKEIKISFEFCCFVE